MSRTPILLYLGAACSALFALYCYSGYAMNVSFSTSAADRYHAQAAMLWIGGAVVFGVIAAVFCVAAVRIGRNSS